MFFSLLILAFIALSNSGFAQSEVSGALAGIVFLDTDSNGTRGPGEDGLSGVLVCSRSNCSETDKDGAYEVDVEVGYRVVWVRQPDNYRAIQGFWRRIPADPFEWLVNFPLETEITYEGDLVKDFTFIHISDLLALGTGSSRVDDEVEPRHRLKVLRDIVENRKPDFLIVTGGLVRDNVKESTNDIRARFELYKREILDLEVPVWNVPGGSDIAEHLIDQSKNIYRQIFGPNYYSFDYGGLHFMGLDTVKVDGERAEHLIDDWYGYVSAEQLGWMETNLSLISKKRPIVVFSHIPLSFSYNKTPPFVYTQDFQILVLAGNPPNEQNSLVVDSRDSISGLTLYTVRNGKIDREELVKPW